MAYFNKPITSTTLLKYQSSCYNIDSLFCYLFIDSTLKILCLFQGAGSASMGYSMDASTMPPGFMPVPIYNMQGLCPITNKWCISLVSKVSDRCIHLPKFNAFIKTSCPSILLLLIMQKKNNQVSYWLGQLNTFTTNCLGCVMYECS